MKECIVSDRSLTMGLDVDAHKSFVVVRDDLTGRVVDQRRVLSTQSAWSDYLRHFPGCSIRAYYEAGCTGFGLQRMLTLMGIYCRVVPASEVAKEANAFRRKTDASDALRLSHTPWVPPHSYARVPTVEEERDRQLIRTREQVLKDRARTKDRIGKLLLYHGLEVPESKGGYWCTRKGLDWLRSVDLGSSSLRFSLDILLSEFDSQDRLIGLLDRALTVLSRTDRYRDKVSLLCAIPGVGLLTSMTFLVEVFRAEEFADARQLAAHVGLTPSEWSSGDRRRQGRITCWGSPNLRRVLVESAWRWVRLDDSANRYYWRLANRRGRKKAIVAMARKLSIAMWAVVKKGEVYAYHWAA